MNLKWLLSLFGLDVKKPLDFILKVLGLLDNQKLTDELQKGLCLNMTVGRRKEVAAKLLDVSKALDNGDCATFAKLVADLLKGIKL